MDQLEHSLLKEKGIQTWIKRNAEKIEMER